MPSRAKDVSRLGKYVVVHESRVDGKQSHEQNNVPSTKEHVPYLYNRQQHSYTLAKNS